MEIKRPSSVILEFNILFFKAVFKWEELEESKKKLKKLEERERKTRKKLEEKNKETNLLKKDIEEFLELLKKIDKQRDEVIFLANDFKEIAHGFHKAHKEVYELYLEAKNQHKEYIESLMKSFKKFWEAYCEVICDECLTKLELVLKGKKHLGEIKKLT